MRHFKDKSTSEGMREKMDVNGRMTRYQQGVPLVVPHEYVHWLPYDHGWYYSQPAYPPPAPYQPQLGPLRNGHWSFEEERYAETVKEFFALGQIPGCRGGVTLRMLLAVVLNCTTMRISKKFAKDKALGKVEYHPSETITDQGERRLREVERAFHASLPDSGLVSSIFQTPGLILLRDYCTFERHNARTHAAPRYPYYPAPPHYYG